MPNLAGVLKEEIRRLARKELRTELAGLKKASTQYRRDIAGLRRELKEKDRRLRSLEARKESTAGERTRSPETSWPSVRPDRPWVISA